MPTILGIHDSSFDSGATLIREGKVVAAVQEERFSRQKHSGGFPWQSIKWILEDSFVDPSEIEAVAIGGLQYDFVVQVLKLIIKQTSDLNPLKFRKDRYLLQIFEKYKLLLCKNSLLRKIDTLQSNNLILRMLRKFKIRAKLVRIDHHLCHAASAYFSSGFQKCLVITADARGDGISASVNIADKGRIHRVATSPVSASMGHFYGGITEMLGFGYARGEGKTMALSAFGEYSNVYEILKPYISVNGLFLEGWMHPHQRLISIPFSKKLRSFRKEDIAFAAQKILEETILDLISNAIEETGITNIALAGGIFLNVKLNQKIMKLPDVRAIFVHPAAGDGGISTGAAYALYAMRYGLKPTQWKHTYFGTRFTNEEIKQALDKTHCEYEFLEDIGGYVGEELLPNGYIIGWFQGRMEYGPRALGARSVLIDPRSNEAPDKVRFTIKQRPAFQPFCPSLLKKAEQRYIQNPKNVNSSFMTISFDARQRMTDETPAVVFIDGSTRVQTVNQHCNGRYHNVLNAFGKKTGIPIVLNTSFNRSGEPIVSTPEQAIHDFIACNLDFLAIGNYLVKKPL